MARTFHPIRSSFAVASLVFALQACTLSVPGGLVTGLKSATTPAGTTTTGSTTGTTTTGVTARPGLIGESGGNMNTSVPSGPADAAAHSSDASSGTVANAGAALISPAHPETPNGTQQAPTTTQAASLKAGAIDDNAKFADYQSFLSSYSGAPMRAYDVSERHVITVTDTNGRPVPNTTVTVAAGDNIVFTGKTYANGQLLFMPKAVPGADVGSRFFVTVGDDTAHATGFNRATTTDWALTVPVAGPIAPKLDLQIVLDTTGSMGGEIAKLQTTLASIATRLNSLPQAPSVRFGLVAFKDRQDSDYLTQKKDFTGSVADFQGFLNGLTASGGGDTPEDDETALSVALGNQSWDASAPVRLSFLITDAPPHIDYPQTTAYTDSIAKAQAMGVKFFTIGASGLPAEGELFLRQLAQATMGQYLFITRGGDEYTGGGEVSATVDQFQEGRLDDIMVDAVKGELANLDTSVATPVSNNQNGGVTQ